MRTISSRQILILLVFGLLVTVALNLTLSKRLSDEVSGEVKIRELELLFGAIEAGPLAIARLQSAAISQQQLSQLMANPQLSDRGIVAAEIFGGENFEYKFSNWKTAESFNSDCVQTHSKTFQFPDAINPFRVQVQVDNCHRVSEERRILKSAALTSLVITFLTLALIAACIWPVAASIRSAENAFRSRFATIGNIVYEPIRVLVREALRSVELEREQSLTTMAQQVSHDIRSPLSALNLAVSALPENNSEQRQLIQAAAKRIDAIAQQLLSARRSILNPEPTDVHALITEIVTEKKLELSQSPDLKLTTKFDIAEPAILNLDKTQFSQALSNLINNSSEALGYGGEVEVGLRTAGRRTEIYVRDNGPGIPASVLSQLNLRQMTSGKNGSALGLSHARNTIERSGGKFLVESKPSQGTTIRMLYSTYRH